MLKAIVFSSLAAAAGIIVSFLVFYQALDAISSLVFLSLVGTFTSTIVLGLPVHFFCLHKNWLKPGAYIAAGVLIGFIALCVILLPALPAILDVYLQGFDMQSLVIPFAITVGGCLGGATFWYYAVKRQAG